MNLNCPWPALDAHLTLNPGDLIAITGPGSSGVSMAALNFAIHAAFNQGVHSEVFSMEITGRDTMEHVLANRARIDSTHFRYRDRLTDDEYERIDAVRQNCDAVPLWALNGPFTVDSIRQVLREHVDRGEPIRLAVADGIHLIDAEPRWSSANTAKAARALKEIAREFGVVFLATVHGEVEGTGRKTRWGVDAGVVDAADALLVLESDLESSARLRLVKGAPGAAGGCVDLLWEPQYSTFAARTSAPVVPPAEPAEGATLQERIAARMAELAGRVEEPPISTPWPMLDAMLRMRDRVKVGVVAQRGSHEATIGRRIAAHAAGEGPVLLFTGFPPTTVPEDLVIDAEPSPTPEHVGEAVARMARDGRTPRLVVIERYERMKLAERPEEYSRADELEWCGRYLGQHDGEWLPCPILLTTVSDREPSFDQHVVQWAGVDSPAGIMTEFCRRLITLSRFDDESVLARVELDDVINPWIVNTVAWDRPPNSRPVRSVVATPVPAPVVAPAVPSPPGAATLVGAVQALETEYAGHRFRSRLEARWAVFFDKLGVRWEYEPERYQLPSGKYLPDFWLPDLRFFFEVKGVAPSASYRRLLEELAEGTGHELVLAVGSIPDPRFYKATAAGAQFWMEMCVPEGDERWEDFVGWARCSDCGAVDVTPGLVRRWVRCGCKAAPVAGEESPEALVLDALRAARSARFEHGESGA